MDFKMEIAKLISAAINADVQEVADALKIPPDPTMGDFAFSCFKLAKELRQAPPVIAKDIASKIEPDMPEFLEKTDIAGPYLNFFVKRAAFAKAVLSEITAKGDKYGSSDIGAGKTIVMDYSSPNIAKRMHIGHLYSTVIGAALNRINNHLGYNVVGINYLGDWGTQFGKLIVAFKSWGKEEDVVQGGVEELERLYVKFHVEVEANPQLEADARAWMLRMQKGDEEALRLWEWFKEISITEYEKMYKRLNIPFDSYRGESYYNDKMGAVVDEIRDKGLLKESEGAMIVDLEEYKMPPCLILRSDGGTLYPTRDIAAAFDRKQMYDFHKSLYVTDMRQSLHFAQFFKVIGLMGYPWENDMVHVPYGLLSFEGDNLSSRKGNTLILADLFDQAAEKVLGIISEKNPGLADKETVAEQVGTGAIVFSALYNTRIKDTVFSWDRIFAFDGETSPYVQYTHARCSSVLNKAQMDYADADPAKLATGEEFELIKTLHIFSEKVAEAAAKYEPFIISRYVMQVARAYNKFYHDNPILRADEDVQKARLMLTKCTKDVIAVALGLLGIKAPDVM
ncbi:MAG: arginine--tRNA ligase [Defluviitaleaceae bacterium]|nr:arginine--tRNA ligase [Defluviitaleaceae bacterium]